MNTPFPIQLDQRYKFVTFYIAFSSDYPTETNQVKALTTAKHVAIPLYFSGTLQKIVRYSESQIKVWDLNTQVYIMKIVYSNL